MSGELFFNVSRETLVGFAVLGGQCGWVALVLKVSCARGGLCVFYRCAGDRQWGGGVVVCP